MLRRSCLVAFSSLLLITLAQVGQAQTGYGVTANGTLFRFDVNSPVTATTIGNLGIVPEGIDFRPGTGSLYAIDVGATTTQLYTVNVETAAITPVGAGFPTVGAYDLTNTALGFDFNPRTLQADGSIRIRVAGTNNDNLRLNSDTGGLAATDTDLAFGDATLPFISAVAYTNGAASTIGGATTLYAIDTRNDALVRIGGFNGPPSPNAGLVTTVGPVGVTIDLLDNAGFDILSTGSDDGLGDELAYAVLRRAGDNPNQFLLYDVNLETGQITNGRLVGGGLDFTGGFAVVPEPSSVSLLALGAVALIRRRR